MRTPLFVGACAVSATALVAASSAACGRDEASVPSGTIAVASSADFRTVFLLSPSGPTVRRVRAPDIMLGLRADLSSSGRRIAIAGSKGIWILSRTGSNARRLPIVRPSATHQPDWVTWAPTGRELVFSRGEGLFTVNASGTMLRKLSNGPVYAPDWSPSGDHIVFVRDPADSTGVGVIQSVGIDGRDVHSITVGGHPDVSPDGSTVAFAKGDGIYVLPITGGKPKLVVRRGEHPEWSPDGDYLAFTRPVECGEGGCSGRVFVVRSTGGRPRPIGPAIFDIGPLSWSE
jgi:Tol biopolymer transport system component